MAVLSSVKVWEIKDGVKGGVRASTRSSTASAPVQMACSASQRAGKSGGEVVVEEAEVPLEGRRDHREGTAKHTKELPSLTPAGSQEGE